MKAIIAAAMAATLVGCLGTPSPLAPHVRGSVGVPHSGALTDAAALPKEGIGFRRLRPEDDIRWGNPRLVRALQRAARAVEEQRPGSPPLMIADLSAKHGGRIPRHRSHRSGRDVDLLFYMLTPDGRPIASRGFLNFGRDGLAVDSHRQARFVRFDVERTWLLVKALMSDQEAHIQFLFVARWLEALVIEHALARGEDDELVYRASVVLRQPGDSFSHNDHFHVRIACTPEERIAGCAGGGPNRPWLPQQAEQLELSDDELITALFDGEDEPAGDEG